MPFWVGRNKASKSNHLFIGTLTPVASLPGLGEQLPVVLGGLAFLKSSLNVTPK